MSGAGELKRKELINHEEPDTAGLTELLSLFGWLLFSSNNCGGENRETHIYLESISATVVYRFEMCQQFSGTKVISSFCPTIDIKIEISQWKVCRKWLQYNCIITIFFYLKDGDLYL